MLSIDHRASSLFLVLAAGLFLVAYALPLLLAPIAWARVLKWRIPGDTDLVVYFGRCVGALATVICGACFAAAAHPEQNVILFDLITAIGGAMVVVHAWGAIRRTQPWTETAEIPLYLALAIVAFAARP